MCQLNAGKQKSEKTNKQKTHGQQESALGNLSNEDLLLLLLFLYLLLFFSSAYTFLTSYCIGDCCIACFALRRSLEIKIQYEVKTYRPKLQQQQQQQQRQQQHQTQIH